MGAGGIEKCLDDIGAGDASVRSDVEQVAGVVVEEVQDLGVGAVGKGPVGEVGLPGFVGLVRFEAAQRGAGPFVRFRYHGACSAQDAVDRCRGRDGDAFALKVGGDGLGTGV